MTMLGLAHLKGAESPEALFWQDNCRIPEDKGPMCMSETLIAAQLWDQPRTVSNNRKRLLLMIKDCY